MTTIREVERRILALEEQNPPTEVEGIVYHREMTDEQLTEAHRILEHTAHWVNHPRSIVYARVVDGVVTVD